MLRLRVLLALASAAAAAAAAALPRFGFYDDNLTATPYATIHQASSLADARATFAAHPSTPSLLLLYDVLFVGAPHAMVLQPEWREQLAAVVSAAEPDFLSGAVIGYNLCVLEMTAGANGMSALRRLLTRAAIAWLGSRARLTSELAAPRRAGFLLRRA